MKMTKLLCSVERKIDLKNYEYIFEILYRVAALFPEHFQSFTMAFQLFFFNNFFLDALPQLYSEA